MKNEPVDALAEGLIPERLDRRRMLSPSLLVTRRESLRADDALAVGVAGRRHAPAGFERCSIRTPELAHRLVGLARVGQGVAGAAIGLDGEPQAVGVREFAHPPGVVVDHQLGHGLSNVPQEPLRDLEALHHPARQHRQERHQVVAPSGPEFLAHPGCPVLRSVFPAIDVRGHQARPNSSGFHAVIGGQPGHHACKVGFDAFPAQLVTLQSASAGRGRGVLNTRARVSETEEGPLTGGDIPNQMTGGVHPGAQVHNATSLNSRRRREVLRHRRCGPTSLESCLAFEVGNPEITRRRNGLHRNVTIEAGDRVGLAQCAFETKRTSEVRFTPDDLLHALLGFDPGTAAAVPPGVIVEVHLQPEPARLGDDVPEEVTPASAHEIDRAHRGTLVHFHDQHAADADAFHGLEVLGDPVAADVAVEPEPIDPGTSLGRRTVKAFLEGAGGRGTDRGEQEQNRKAQDGVGARAHSRSGFSYCSTDLRLRQAETAYENGDLTTAQSDPAALPRPPEPA